LRRVGFFAVSAQQEGSFLPRGLLAGVDTTGNLQSGCPVCLIAEHHRDDDRRCGRILAEVATDAMTYGLPV
jgi:hypothetical protein